MARLIPTGDVAELPLEVPDTSRLDRGLHAPTEPPRPLGARGPQVNRFSFQGPQQPAGLQSTAAAVNPTPVQSALAAEARAPTALGRTTAAVGRGAGVATRLGLGATRLFGPAALGAETVRHFNDYKIDDPDTDSSASGTFKALRDGDFAGAWRSQRKGLLETGMDLGSAGAGLADFVTPGKNTASRAYGDFLRNQFGNQLVDNTGLAAGAPSGAAPTATATAAPIQNIMPPQAPSAGGLTPTDPSQPAPGATPAITRVGNSFSDGSTDPSKAGFGVSTIPGSGLRASSQDVIDQAQRTDIAEGHMPGMTGFRDSATEERNAGLGSSRRQYLLEQAMNGTSRSGRAAAIAGIAQGDTQRSQDRNTASQERIAGLRDRGETTRAAAANLLQRGLHADANAVAIRGQDATLAGHRMANDVAVANQRREQFNSDRNFTAGRDDAGRAATQVQHQNAADAVKRTTDEFTATIPPGADGKPDTQTGARYALAAHAMVGDRIAELEKVQAQNPGDATSAAQLAALKSQGMDALGAKTKAKFLAGQQLNDVVAATTTNGLTPWGTRAVRSNAPIMSIKKNSDGDYVTNRHGVNGETEVIPGRYIEKEGSFFGLGGRATNKYSHLIEN